MMRLVSQELGLNSSVLAATMNSPDVESIVAAHVTYSRRVLGLDRGQTILVANGRASFAFQVVLH